MIVVLYIVFISFLFNKIIHWIFNFRFIFRHYDTAIKFNNNTLVYINLLYVVDFVY